MVAPSGMMDGQVAAIRDALDAAGFQRPGILAYAAKFASAFYGPFRDAAECAPRFGDRAGYQMDPAERRRGAPRGAGRHRRGRRHRDGQARPAVPGHRPPGEGRDRRVPVAAYNVSGEYAMVKAAALNGWLDERRTVLEVLTSIRRAGADLILTYHAKDAAAWLPGEPPPVAPRRGRTWRSAELFERAQRLIPGGVNSPVRAYRRGGRDAGLPRRGARAPRSWTPTAAGTSTW